jgi:hypothetical protein
MRLELLLAIQRAIADCGADRAMVRLDGDELDTVAAAGTAARHQSTRRPLPGEQLRGWLASRPRSSA